MIQLTITLLQQNTTSLVQEMVSGNWAQVLFDFVGQSVGITLTSFILIGVLGAITIFTQSFAPAAILIVLLLPIAAGIVTSGITQILVQVSILIVIALVYAVIKNE